MNISLINEGSAIISSIILVAAAGSYAPSISVEHSRRQLINERTREEPSSIARTVNVSLTSSPDIDARFYGGSGIMHKIEFATQPAKNGDSLSVAKALAELNAYRTLKDGWQGPSSHAPNAKAFAEAELFIEKMTHELPKAQMPMFGIDNDGEIVLTWNDENLIGSLAIAGDGHYCYFIENRRTNHFASGNAQLAVNIDGDFRRVFASA